MRIVCSLWLFTATIAAGQERSFVACPIVRDTKTVPCFLAEYEGQLYYLGIQQDITAGFHPPQLKHPFALKTPYRRILEVSEGSDTSLISASC